MKISTGDLLIPLIIFMHMQSAEDNSVYLIRHAESQYNIKEAKMKQLFEGGEHPEQFKSYIDTPEYLELKFNQELEDAAITELGKKQSKECAQILIKNKVQIDLIIVSPMRRALMTCASILQEYYSQNPHANKVNVMVDPDFREIFESGCDVGSRLRESMKNYPDYDYTLIKHPDYWYVESLVDEQIKNSILQKIEKEPLQKKYECAKREMFEFLKYFWSKRQANRGQEQDLKKKVLPSTLKQKEKLKMLNKKYKSIAVVSHSENIKSFIGYKPANCAIVKYEADFFDKKADEVPRNQLK